MTLITYYVWLENDLVTTLNGFTYIRCGYSCRNSRTRRSCSLHDQEVDPILDTLLIKTWWKMNLVGKAFVSKSDHDWHLFDKRLLIMKWQVHASLFWEFKNTKQTTGGDGSLAKMPNRVVDHVALKEASQTYNSQERCFHIRQHMHNAQGSVINLQHS